jgi:hypothetical protein
MPRDVFLGQIVKGAGDLGEILDESAVEVGKPKETTDVLEVLGSWPVMNGFDLAGIHCYLSLPDDQAQILNLGAFELAFFRTKVKVMLT